MTQVTFDLTNPTSDGTRKGADGAIQCTPFHRHVDGTTVVLPVAMAVQLVDGKASVEMEPTSAGWCWRVDERVPGGDARYVLVPDSPTPVAYTALVDVDPTTLVPTGPAPVDAWATALNTATANATASATSSASTATASATNAGNSAAAAGNSATAAATARDQAAASATNAGNSATAAAAAGSPGATLAVALPNLLRAIRTYDDSVKPTLRVIGLGSSVGLGPDGTFDATNSPSAHFASRLNATVNKLGNLVMAQTNGSVGGSIITDGYYTHYAAAKTTAGGTPTIVTLCYGMNDGMPAQYHTGQTYPGVYSAMKNLIGSILADGGDPVVVTSPHPHSQRTAWNAALGTITYPSSGVEIPAATLAASVVTADWSGTGVMIPASYRHLRVNQAMRLAASEMGVPVIDAERAWFKAVATYGEDFLFNTGEYAHPNLLGHQQSYWVAMDAFMDALSKSTVQAGVSQVTGWQTVLVKNSNAALTSTTTLADDNQLITPTVSAGIYEVDLGVFFTGTAGDLRVGLNLPAGSTGSIGLVGPGTTATSTYDVATARRVTLPDTYGLPVGGDGADAYATVKAIVRVTTPGTITARWCQDTSSAATTTVYADTFMRVRKVA